MDQDFYLAFEQQFRGERQEIIKRLEIYGGLLDELCERHPGGSTIDLGCGRGEWIEMCNARGFRAHGLDLDPSMISDCCNRGLQVSRGDALEFLKDLPDQSQAMVSAFHVIEHVERSYFLDLCRESLRVLAPAGVLVMETPSIDNLLVASKAFHSDPTHRSPIHPEATCFTLQYMGYEWAQSFYINCQEALDVSTFGLGKMLRSVAQDVVILASTRSLDMGIDPNGEWSAPLRRTPATLEAADRTDLTHLTRHQEQEHRCQEMERQISAINRHLRYLETHINSVYESTSWKLTRPVRWFGELLKKIKGSKHMDS